MSKSKVSDNWIIVAINSGYTATDDGVIMLPEGVPQKERNNTSGYKVFNLRWALSNRIQPQIRSHRFAAAFFFGIEVLDADCIRHLDGSRHNNSRTNLRPGTHFENSMDRPIDARKLKASIALAAVNESKRLAAVVSAHRKLTDDNVVDMQKMRASLGLTYKEIGMAYGVSDRAASRACNGLSFRAREAGQ